MRSRIPVIDRVCPTCAAKKGKPCVRTKGIYAGRILSGYHKPRNEMYSTFKKETASD